MTGTASSRSTAGRWFSAASLALYLLVGALAPIADGLLDARDLDRVVHIEAGGGTPCEPVHNHLTCHLCQFDGGRQLFTTMIRSAAGSLVVATVAGPVGTTRPAGSPRISSSRPRAPPLA